MNHDECRRRVCIVCIGKASGTREITQRKIELVKLYCRDDFSIDDPDYPCGLCNSCHSRLYKKERDSTTVIQVEPFTPDRSHMLRSIISCDCRICSVAKVSGALFKKLQKKRGRPKETQPQPPFKSVTVCAECLTELYQGCNHVCNRSTKLENIEKHLASPTKTTSTRLLKRQKQNQRPRKSQPVSISAESISDIGINMNLSVRRSRELAQHIRTATGKRLIIEKGAQKKMRDHPRVSQKT